MKKMNPPSGSDDDLPIPRTGRIGRLAQIIEKETDKSTLYSILKDVHEFKSYTYPQKAAYLKKVITQLENITGKGMAKEIMKHCGQRCCGKTSRNRARELMEESESLDEFVEKMNASGLGGGRLTMQDSHTITGGYDRCYCGQVKQTREPFPSLTYCHCSAGWYSQLFESVLHRPVSVDIVQSIICGADSCEFIIHL
jgi:predicted hydrocarbon binding protein